jgi:hypothetical protein
MKRIKGIYIIWSISSVGMTVLTTGFNPASKRRMKKRAHADFADDAD